MIKFFLGMLAGFVLCMIIFTLIGAYRENMKLEAKLKEYEEEKNEQKSGS